MSPLPSVSYLFLEAGGGEGEAEGWGLLTDITLLWVCVCSDLILTTMQRKC